MLFIQPTLCEAKSPIPCLNSLKRCCTCQFPGAQACQGGKLYQEAQTRWEWGLPSPAQTSAHCTPPTPPKAVVRTRCLPPWGHWRNEGAFLTRTFSFSTYLACLAFLPLSVQSSAQSCAFTFLLCSLPIAGEDSVQALPPGNLPWYLSRLGSPCSGLVLWYLHTSLPQMVPYTQHEFKEWCEQLMLCFLFHSVHGCPRQDPTTYTLYRVWVSGRGVGA
jgi:hypothetical protein